MGGKNMKKSKLLLIVSIVLAVALSVGGTLAYLTDTDEDVNVMTLGNVDIEQIELQRAPGVAYNATAKEGDLVPFVEGQPLYPAYPKADAVNPYTAAPNGDLFNWGPYVYTGTAGNGLFNDEKLTGALDKFVFVKNTGTSDAYFRTWLAFECPESLEYDGDEVKDLWINATSSQKYQWIGEEYLTIEGTRYLVMCAVYQDALAPGNTSHPSLLQVALSHKTDNEDMEALGETYEILAFTEAVQTKNLESIGASQALGIVFDKDGDGVATINDHPWQDGVEGLPTKTVSTAAELKDALAEGGIVVLGNDIELADEDSIMIPAGVKSELILNGKTISQENAPSTTYAIIWNKGELTITGEGTITYADVNNYTADVNYSCSTIRNEGVLNIEGGTIENVTAAEVMNYSYPHAIDVYQGSVTNITGGTVKSENYDAIRMFCNSETLATEVNISGGNIVNRISFQDPSGSKSGYGILNISGGTFTTQEGVTANIRLLNFSNVCSNMKATITGGTFDTGYMTQNYGAITGEWISIADGVDLNEVQ